jgi:hypothetical protein
VLLYTLKLDTCQKPFSGWIPEYYLQKRGFDKSPPVRLLLNTQLEHGNLLAFNRADLNLVGVIHEGLCNCLH